MDIQNILMLSTASLNLGAGIITLMRNYRDRVNLFYFLFSVFIAFWCICLILFRYYRADFISDIAGRSSYIAGLLMSYFYYLFTAYFPYPNKELKKTWLVLFFMIFLYFSVVILFTDFFVISTYMKEGVATLVTNKLNFAFFAIVLGSVVSVAIKNLYLKFKTVQGVYRHQLNVLLLVSLIAASMGYIFDVIMPFFGDFSLNWLGALFLSLMVLSMGRMMIVNK